MFESVLQGVQSVEGCKCNAMRWVQVFGVQPTERAPGDVCFAQGYGRVQHTVGRG